MKAGIKWMVLVMSGAFLLSCAKDETVPHGSGFIEATEIDISAEAAGRLLSLPFDEADSVGFGDTLAIIDTTTTVLRLRQAKAKYTASTARTNTARIAIGQAQQAYSLAQKEFNRISTLVKSGSATQQQYDKAETSFIQAELALKQARAGLATIEAETSVIKAEIDLLLNQLSDCFPLAPVNGTVITSFREAGELVAPGLPLYTIASLDTVTVKVYLPPDDLTRISLRQACTVDPEDKRDKPLSGWVKWIASEAEFTPKNVQTKEARADLVYAVEINIPNPDHILKIGMPVMVRIP
jgi:HlyD family secretion protein